MVSFNKILTVLTFVLYISAGAALAVLVMSGLIIREALSFIIYGTAIAAIGIVQVSIILHPYGRRSLLLVFAALAVMLGTASLVFLNPHTFPAIAPVPGAVTGVLTYLLGRTGRDPGGGGPIGKGRKARNPTDGIPPKTR